MLISPSEDQSSPPLPLNVQSKFSHPESELKALDRSPAVNRFALSMRQLSYVREPSQAVIDQVAAPTDGSTNGMTDGLAALKFAASQRERSRTDRGATSPVRRPRSVQSSVSTPSCSTLAASYAAPASPLKERDIRALTDFFGQDTMAEIEADVDRQLMRLLPAPCWEDDPFEFLQEFL